MTIGGAGWVITIYSHPSQSSERIWIFPSMRGVPEPGPRDRRIRAMIDPSMIPMASANAVRPVIQFGASDPWSGIIPP